MYAIIHTDERLNLIDIYEKNGKSIESLKVYLDKYGQMTKDTIDTWNQHQTYRDLKERLIRNIPENLFDLEVYKKAQGDFNKAIGYLELKEQRCIYNSIMLENKTLENMIQDYQIDNVLKSDFSNQL